MSRPGPPAPSPFDAATEICLRMIRGFLARATARNRKLNLILLAALTVLFLVTLVAFGLSMSK